MLHLYHLLDADRNVRYVGLTDDPDRRLGEHLARADRMPTPLAFWIRGLRAAATEPTLDVVERIGDWAEGRRTEAYWIRRQWADGWQLLNTQCLGILRNPRTELAWTPCDYALLAHHHARRALYYMRLSNLTAEACNRENPGMNLPCPCPEYDEHYQRVMVDGPATFADPKCAAQIHWRRQALQRVGVTLN